MNSLKIKATALALAAVLGTATAFAGCGGNKDSSMAESTTETTTVTETTTMAPETTYNSTASGDMAEVTTGTTLSASMTGLMDAITGAAEWTMLMDVTEAERLKEMGLDPANANYEEIAVKQAGISASFAEIVVIKAKDTEAALKDLTARKEKMTADTFYPEHQEQAKQAVVGKHGDYVYLIGHTEGTKVEEALKSAIDKL